MNTIFRNIADILDEGCDMNITVRRNSDKLVCSVSFNNNSVKDEAKNLIPPFVLSGTPEEMDEGFTDAVKEPMQKSRGLQSSMMDYEAALQSAKANSKEATEAKKKESETKKKEADAEKKRKESFKKAIEQGDKLKSEKKWKEAIKAYQLALPHADDAGKKKVEDLITMCRNNDQPMMFDAFDDDIPEASENTDEAAQETVEQETEAETEPEPEDAPEEQEEEPAETENDPFSEESEEDAPIDWTGFDDDED